MAGNVAADLLVHVGADTKDAVQGLSDMGDKTNSFGNSFSKTGLLMGAASAGIVGGLGMAVMSAANFDQALADVNSVANLSASQFDAVRQKALEIGAATSFSATEGAMAIGELVKAGVSVDDALAGAADSAALMAQAGGISIPDAATVMANSMNIFGIAGSDAASVADTFAAAANASAADIGGLAQAMSQGGPAAAAMGMSLQDTTGALALFANYGIQGSDAGTSLKTMLMSLANPSAEAAAKMSELGINAFDAQGNFVGMSDLAGQLKSQLGGLTQEQQQAALATIFGSDAMRVANILFQEGAEGVDDMTAAVNDQGAAQRMAETRMNTLSGSIESLKGSFETAMIIIGTGFLPVLRKGSDLANKAITAFTKLGKPFQKFIGIAAAAVAGFLGIGAAIGVIGPMLAPAIAGIFALVAPLLLIIGIVALFALAWKTNFLGVRDIVGDAIGGISGFFSDFIGYMKEVESSGRLMNDKLAQFPKPLQDIAVVLAAVIDGFIDFARVIGSGGSLSQAWDDLTDRFSNPLFLKSLKGIADSILGIFSSIPWGAIGSALLSGLVAAIGLLGDAISYLYPIGLDLLAGLLQSLIDNWPTISGWLGEMAGKVLEATGSALLWLAGLGLDLLTGLVNSLNDNWPTISAWLSIVGEMILASIGSLATTLASKGLELLQGLLQSLNDNWPTIKAWLAMAGPMVLAAIIGFDTLLLSKGMELIQGLLDGINQAWPTIAGWLKMLPSLYLAYLQNVGEILLPIGRQLLEGLLNGINEYWPTVSAWLSLVGTMVLAAIGDALAWLLPKGLDMIQGLLQGLNENWPLIQSWLSLVGSMVLAAIGDMAAWLLPKGLELLGGLLQGLNEQWPTIMAWLGLVGSMVLAALGDMAQWLLPKGLELLGGLLQGLNDNWPTIVAWLGQLGSMILGALGSLAETLLPAGEDLLNGMYDGLVATWPTVKSWIDALPGLLLTAVSMYATLYLTAGKLLLSGMWSGLLAVWPTIKGWLDALPGLLLQAVSMYATLYLTAGKLLISGLWSGALSAWSTVSSWISSIGGMALSALGDTGVLWQAGWDLMMGLWGGIKAGFDWVISQVSGFAGAIKDAKGPRAYDLKVLIPNGNWLMEGLSRGLDQGWQDVRSQISGYAPSLSGSFLSNFQPEGVPMNGPSMPGQGQTIQYIQIDAHFDDVEDMVRAAEFVKDLGPTRQMYFDVER